MLPSHASRYCNKHDGTRPRTLLHAVCTHPNSGFAFAAQRSGSFSRRSPGPAAETRRLWCPGRPRTTTCTRAQAQRWRGPSSLSARGTGTFRKRTETRRRPSAGLKQTTCSRPPPAPPHTWLGLCTFLLRAARRFDLPVEGWGLGCRGLRRGRGAAAAATTSYHSVSMMAGVARSSTWRLAIHRGDLSGSVAVRRSRVGTTQISNQKPKSTLFLLKNQIKFPLCSTRISHLQPAQSFHTSTSHFHAS